MIRVIFVGNRPKVLEKLINNDDIVIVKAFVLEQPMISDSDKIEIIRLKAKNEKDLLIEYISQENFDICISAGCSYVLPMNFLPQDKLYINCHPSVLPYGKGIHPLNECFLSDKNIAGATIHLLTDELDAGDILNQVKFDLTDEIDVSDLYGFIFDLEAELLEQTMYKIIENDMRYNAKPQVGEGSYYSREKLRRKFIANSITSDEMIKNVRAFSSANLGVELVIDELTIIAYSAISVKNSFINERYKNKKSGDLIFKNDDVLFVKVIDGIVKINKFKTLHRANL